MKKKNTRETKHSLESRVFGGGTAHMYVYPIIRLLLSTFDFPKQKRYSSLDERGQACWGWHRVNSFVLLKLF